MVMDEQMKRYKKSLINTPGPILLSQCPQIKMDLRGMMKYAESVGKKVSDLTVEEKYEFFGKNIASWNFK